MVRAMPDTAAATRESALQRAAAIADSGRLKQVLAGLVAIPSTSQDEAGAPHLERYLREGLLPWLERLGFTVAIHPNPEAGFGPILTGVRIEDPARPTALLYGHCGSTAFTPH